MAVTPGYNVEIQLTAETQQAIRSFNELGKTKEQLIKNFENLGGALKIAGEAMQLSARQALGVQEGLSKTLAPVRETSYAVWNLGKAIPEGFVPLRSFTVELERTQERAKGTGISLESLAVSFWVIGITLIRTTRYFEQFISVVTKAGEEAERASVKLSAALNPEAISSFQRGLERLGATPLFTSAQVASAATFAAQLGLNEKQTEKLAMRAAELAKAYSVDLPSAMETLTRYIENGSVSLLRQVGVIRSSEEEQAALEAIMGKTIEQAATWEIRQARIAYALQVTSGATVAWATYLGTGEARLDLLNTRLNDTYQSLYQQLRPALENVLATTISLVQAFKDFLTSIGPVGRQILMQALSFGTLAGVLLTLGTVFTVLLSPLNLLITGIGNLATEAVVASGSMTVGLGAVLTGLATTVIPPLVVGLIGLGAVLALLKPTLDSATTSTENLSSAYNLLGGLLTSLSTHLQEITDTLRGTSEEGQLSVGVIQYLTQALNEASAAASAAASAFNSALSSLQSFTTKGISLISAYNSGQKSLASLHERLEDLELRRAKLQTSLHKQQLQLKQATDKYNKTLEEDSPAKRAKDELALLRREQALQRATWNVYAAEWALENLRKEASRGARDLEIATNQLDIARRVYGEDSWEAWEAERNLLIVSDNKAKADFNVLQGQEKLNEAILSLKEAQLAMVASTEDLAKASNNVADALAKVNIEGEDVANTLASLNDVNKEIANVSAEITDKEGEQTKTQDKLKELFGDSYEAIGPFLEEMDWLKELVELGIVKEEDYIPELKKMAEAY